MIIANTPKVKISGKPANGGIAHDDETGVSTYKMRRLSTRDTFKLISILEVGARASGTDLRTFDLGDLDDPAALVKNLGQLMFSAMAFAADEVIELCASLVGVPVNLLSDGEYFPMGSEVQIIQGLTQHPDAAALIKLLGNALSGMQPTTPAPASPEVSTPSSTDTDTQTTTS